MSEIESVNFLYMITYICIKCSVVTLYLSAGLLGHENMMFK